MPTPTYIPMATVTLGSSASSVTFSSIPATFRDLVLVVQCQASVNTQISVRLNGDTGSNYSIVSVHFDSSTTATTTGFFLNHFDQAANTDLTSVFQIMDYSATDKHKTGLVRSNAVTTGGSRYPNMMANRFASTAAVTSLALITGSGNLNSGSRFDLYGIAS